MSRTCFVEEVAALMGRVGGDGGLLGGGRVVTFNDRFSS